MSAAAMSQLFQQGTDVALLKPPDSLRPDYHLDSCNLLNIFKSKTPTCLKLSDDI